MERKTGFEAFGLAMARGRFSPTELPAHVLCQCFSSLRNLRVLARGHPTPYLATLKNGAEDGIRTRDLRHGKATL